MLSCLGQSQILLRLAVVAQAPREQAGSAGHLQEPSRGSASQVRRTLMSWIHPTIELRALICIPLFKLPGAKIQAC